MAPKYADISCLRVAFEAGHGWRCSEGHRARVYNSSVPQRGWTHPTHLNPLPSINKECRLERKQTYSLNVNKAAIMTDFWGCVILNIQNFKDLLSQMWVN